MAVPLARYPVRVAFALALYLGLVLGGSLLGGWVSQSLDITIWPHTEPMFHRVIVTGLMLYVVLTAVPFVPGIEIGLALIFVFGPRIVPIIYVATIAALSASFLVGRLVPERWLAAAFGKLGLLKAERLVGKLAPLNTQERVAHIVRNTPRKWIPWLLRHRLLTLAALLNLPGSSLIGGGGGIAMAVGLSRLVPLPKFILGVALAVSPVPLLILATETLGRSALW